MRFRKAKSARQGLRIAIKFLLLAIFLAIGIHTGLSDQEQFGEYQPKGDYGNPYHLHNGLEYTADMSLLDQRVERFLKKWGISGLSLSVARDEKLVFTRAYGFARKDSVRAQPYHLFRIASVSKLITAAAVVKLISGGWLSLDSKVFGPEGILKDSLYHEAVDPRVHDIRIIHLLEHSAGWWFQYGDHMFMPDHISEYLGLGHPPSAREIISFALSKKLHFTPGSYSSYSNLGYVILGEVISEVAGQDYESYVREKIMAPLGIRRSYLAGNTRSEAREDEVYYYEATDADSVPALDGSGRLVARSEGGNDVKTLGSAGGWIISSVDLLKFTLAIDGRPGWPDLFPPGWVRAMQGENLTGSLLGWRGSSPDGKIWRTGFFAGSTAVVMIQPDGFTWVVLANTSAWKGADFTAEIMKLMNSIFPRVIDWPETDLFCSYSAKQLRPVNRR